MDAEAALAQKISMPERVDVQRFSQDTNENELNEVHILAEAAIERGIQIDVGLDGATRLLDAIPIYPVSRQSFPIVRSLSDIQRRPAERAEAKAMAQRRAAQSATESLPVGVMIFEAEAGAGLPDFDNWHLGQGANGPLLGLSGVHLQDTEVTARIASAFVQNGVNLAANTLVIAPYVEGRTSVTSAKDYSFEQSALFLSSAIMISFGLALLFAFRPSLRKPKRRNAGKTDEAIEDFPAAGPFQPIANQDDLVEDTDETAARTPSRIMTVASHALRPKSRQ